MKRIVCLFAALCFILLLSILPCRAVGTRLFDSDVSSVEDSLPDEADKYLSDAGIDGVEDLVRNGFDGSSATYILSSAVSRYLSAPLSALVVLISVIIFASILESYTYSLRYTETGEIMRVAVCLFSASAVISPLVELIESAVNVIHGASSVMLVYLPVMAGIMAFSGHTITSAGYYAAVVGAAQGISALSYRIILPMLNVFLSLCIGMSVSGRVRLHGIAEMTAKFTKWTLTLITSMFAAIVGLNGALSSAGDGIAGRAVKFTLSSVIPIIGASISEAYSAIRGSVDLLRSGLGVFVIISLFFTFVPLLIKILLWSAALFIAKTVGESFGVSSAANLIGSLSSFFTVLRAIVISVMAAFVISTAVMMKIGGSA